MDTVLSRRQLFKRAGGLLLVPLLRNSLIEEKDIQPENIDLNILKDIHPEIDRFLDRLTSDVASNPEEAYANLSEILRVSPDIKPSLSYMQLGLNGFYDQNDFSPEEILALQNSFILKEEPAENGNLISLIFFKESKGVKAEVIISFVIPNPDPNSDFYLKEQIWIEATITDTNDMPLQKNSIYYFKNSGAYVQKGVLTYLSTDYGTSMNNKGRYRFDDGYFNKRRFLNDSEAADVLKEVKNFVTS